MCWLTSKPTDHWGNVRLYWVIEKQLCHKVWWFWSFQEFWEAGEELVPSLDERLSHLQLIDLQPSDDWSNFSRFRTSQTGYSFFGLTDAVRRHSHTFALPPSAAASFFIRCCDYSCSPAPPFSSVSSVDMVSMETGSAVDYFLIRTCLVRQTHLPSSSSS